MNKYVGQIYHIELFHLKYGKIGLKLNMEIYENRRKAGTPCILIQFLLLDTNTETQLKTRLTFFQL